MATAILVTIATGAVSGVLTEVIKKAVGAASESSLVEISRYAIFGDLAPDLRLLEKELRKLSSVLDRAQRIDAMQYEQNDLLLSWLGDVKDAACHADNLLEEIAYEKIRRKKKIEASLVAKLFTISDTSFRFRMRIAGDIKKFSSLTAEIYKGAETTLHLTQLVGNDSTTSNQPSVHENLRELREVADTSNVTGREADLKLVVESLCRQHDHPVLSVVPIVGRSGVGKTTLAKMVYDNETVKKHFGTKTWIFVSDNFSLRRVLDEMLQSITGESCMLTNISKVEEMLKEHVQKDEKGYLLVLDDVWNLDMQKWEVVRSVLVRITGSIGCSVLVTTQLSQVAEIMCGSPAHQLKDLSDCDAWVLFEKLAFARKTPEQSSELKDVGRSILSKCQGLPLAIKTMGSLLSSMSDKSSWESVEKSEIWSLSLDQSKIMPWLLISFHHLPNTSIKQCFVHCSISIEKGQTVQQSDLIQAWMAQGFVQSTTESDMGVEKDIGEKYVDYLVSYGLLQVFKVSDYMCLKMHDLVHDMARYISKDTIWISHKAHDLHTATKAEHIRINGEDSLVSVYNLPQSKTLSKLRTLICTRATLSIDFGAQTKFLRDLRLIYCEMEVVPSSIGKLKHLRYLSLRGNPFRRLPESVCKLFNLQMLDLAECYNLDGLPLGINKLYNLKIVMSETNRWRPYLYLSCVRILSRHRFTTDEGFEIKDLKSLEFVGGDVEMSGLHRINCNEMEAQSLIANSRIKRLFLNWGPLELQVADDDDGSNDEGVMDGLHPHSNLEEIHVYGFGGKRFSSWILHMSNLKTIVLYSCNRCEQLPTLGQLASLQKLDIYGMRSVEVIGAEFYQNNEGRASTSSGMRRGGILFPRLESLCLRNMQKLREWVEPSGEYEQLFPKLYKLEIRDCPLLSNAPTFFSPLSRLNSKSGLIPDLRSLRYIYLDGFGGKRLSSWLVHMSNLETIVLKSCNRCEQLPTLGQLASLQKLDIDGMESLEVIGAEFYQNNEGRASTSSDMRRGGILFPQLRTLCLRNMQKLREWVDPSGEYEQLFPKLWELEIIDCPLLSSAPASFSSISRLHTLRLRNSKLGLIPYLRRLSSIRELSLVNFQDQMSIPEWMSCLLVLRNLTIGGFNEELEELDGAAYLPKGLRHLELDGWPKLKSIPSELQTLKQLNQLVISEFEELESLPEWIGNLSSLESLRIRKCKNLKNLPSHEAMRRLTHLRPVEILECPNLRKLCREYEYTKVWRRVGTFEYKYTKEYEGKEWDSGEWDYDEDDKEWDSGEDSINLLFLNL